VAIRYQPTYPPANTVVSGMVSAAHYQLSPDLAVEVWRAGEVIKALIFDAKYRTMPDGASQTYLEEDVTKMDHYFNTIRWKPQNPRQRLQRVVSSAYILYPGDVLEHDADEPEIGALPWIPGLNLPSTSVKGMRHLLEWMGLLGSHLLTSPDGRHS